MTTTTFDTLAYSKRMKAAGFSQKQAEEQAEALSEMFSDNLATKQDIKNLDNSLKLEIKDLEHRMTVKLGSIIAFSIVAIPFILKLVNFV